MTSLTEVATSHITHYATCRASQRRARNTTWRNQDRKTAHALARQSGRNFSKAATVTPQPPGSPGRNVAMKKMAQPCRIRWRGQGNRARARTHTPIVARARTRRLRAISIEARAHSDARGITISIVPARPVHSSGGVGRSRHPCARHSARRVESSGDSDQPLIQIKAYHQG